MVVFALIAAVIAVAVLAWVLRPMWAHSRGFVIATVVLLGLGTAVLYGLLGTPAGLRDANASRIDTPRDIDEAVADLRAALARDPGQVEGWMLLGRALLGQEKYTEAADAFAHAVKLQPDHPEVLVSAAQARMLAAGSGQADATAIQWLQHALAVQPEHQRARWFLGVAQRQAGQPGDAAATWAPLLAQVDGGTQASLLAQINAARAEAGQPPIAAPPPSRSGLAVEVSAAPGWRTRLPDDTTVFVIARIPDGPPMPVAVEKHTLSELPLTVHLDDGDSPMPTAKLSALGEVEVIARISPSGNAMPQEGDITSAPVRVKLPADAPVRLTVGE
ncbi:tetratricopeptide repeat protein [Stenotrophomonas sp. HITSZ_GD]|uniref:tetratricopeptide repeat protein n=1 Tax=Stenotrophomonas sp. HITSZ_GD TaxID=3037248 RepID=UPI00240D7115|nr:tetratricopeptide repeat protein [Stenotrophomonas sp. HITSZ_GD]MDG2524417.1 tetratricopeptide repeat protein [Stenotrophomonas sp. HITSZ_GD]